MLEKRRRRLHKRIYLRLGGTTLLIAFFVYGFFLIQGLLSETEAQQENMPQDLSQQLKDFGLFNSQNTDTTTQNNQKYDSIESFFQTMEEKEGKIKIENTPTNEKSVSSDNITSLNRRKTETTTTNENIGVISVDGTDTENSTNEKSSGILGFFNKLAGLTTTEEEKVQIPLDQIKTETTLDQYIIKVKGDKTLAKAEFLEKGFIEDKDKLKGKLVIDLKDSNGKMPFNVILQSSDEKISVDIPAETIFKTKDNQDYTGIFIPPTKDNGWSVFSKKTNFIKAGSPDTSIEMVDKNGESVYATIQMTVDKYNVGDLVEVYSSEDGNNRELLTKTNVKKNITIGKYVSFQTNHFTTFALGSSTGTFAISNDAYTTTGTYVTLNGNISGATKMRFGTSTTLLANANRVNYSSSTGFYLSGLSDGIAVVYAQYSGNGISTNVSDSIVLDTFSGSIITSLLANIDGTTIGTDVSGKGNNFTNTAGSMSSSSGEYFMTFNGTTAYETSAASLITAYPFSFSARIRPSKVTGLQTIVHAGRTNSTLYERGVVLTGNKVAFTLRNTTAYYSPGSGTIKTGQWYNIVGVFNSATDKRIYINGKLDHSYTTSVAFSNATQNRIRIGAKSLSTASSFFSGNIDEVRIYSKALTNSEISGLYMREPSVEPMETFDISPKILGFMPNKMYTINIDVCNNTLNGTAIGNNLWSVSALDCVPIGYNKGVDYAKTITGRYSNVYGNTGSFVISSGLIVNVPDITYTPTSGTLTMNNVLAKIAPFDLSWSLTNNGASTGYTFIDNGNFNFELADQAGNTGAIAATVDWISHLSFAGVISGTTYGYYTGVTINFSGNFLSGAILSGLNNNYYNTNFQDGGTISGGTVNSGGTYKFTIYDTSGNSTGATFTILNLISATLTSNVSNYTSGAFVVTGTFSEDVTNFSQAKISGYNANISNFTTVNNHIFYRTVTPISDGPVSIRISQDAVKNASNNTNRVSNIITSIYDHTAPIGIFNGETPGNYYGINSTTFTGQLQISEANLKQFTRQWSGLNYTLYDSGLVLMMNFDNIIGLGESNSVVKDLSPYQNNGVISGATRSGAGKYGGAFTFDGTNSYIDIATNTFLHPSSISVGGRVKFNTGETQWMLVDAGRGMASGAYYIYGEDLAYPTFSVYSSTGQRYDAGVSFQLNPGNRYHIIGTYDQNTKTAKLYINGNLKATTTNAYLGTNNTSNITIGDYGSDQNGYRLNGMIDEIRMYNYALSDNEVRQLYQSNLSKIDSETRTFKTIYTGLTYGQYMYTGLFYDILGYSSSTGRIVNLDESNLVYLPTDTTNTSGIIDYFQSKGFSYTATGLLGSTGINLKNNNIVCPQTPVNLESTGSIGGNKTVLELPGCTKILSQGLNFTGLIEIPRIKNKSFTLINNTQDYTIFAGSSGSQISFTNTGNSNTITGKVHIPAPDKTLGAIMDIYSSQDTKSRNYEGTGQVISRNGQKYVTIETTHLTYFTLGTYTGNFVINNDNPSTTSKNVTLNMNVSGATYMKFGNTEAEAEAASWISYSGTYPRVLSGSLGPKTIYAMFTDGSETGYVNDSITLESNTVISNLQLIPPLNISYFGSYIFSAEISGEINTGAIDILGINGNGNNCISYYASGSCAATGGISLQNYPLTYSGDKARVKTDISPDSLYPEIFFTDSDIMYINTGNSEPVQSNNYSLINMKNPLTITGNSIFWIELGLHTGSNENIGNLEIYLVKSGVNISSFNSDRRNSPGVEFVSSLNKSTPYSHTHPGNLGESHYLIALASNSDGTIGQDHININGDFWIVLFNNSANIDTWNLKYLPSSLCNNTNSRYVGNTIGRQTVSKSGCPDVHVHIVRRSTPPGGTSADGVQVTTYAYVTGGIISGSQTFNFQATNILPNPSSFITPKAGNLSGNINISRYPATDGNMDSLSYSISLLSSTGVTIQTLTGNTQSTGFIRDSTSVNDGIYSLSGSVKDGSGETVFYLGDTFIIDNTNPVLTFTGGTPANNGTISTPTFSGIIEIIDNNLSDLIRKRSGTQYNLYNSGLISLLNFNNIGILGENGTIIKDFSIYNNTGIAIGATRTGTGKFGGAYSFNGINNYIKINNIPSNTSSGFTRSTRVNITIPGNYMILDQREGEEGYQPIRLFSGGTVGAAIEFGNTTDGNRHYFDIEMTTGTRYQITMTLSGTNVYCYLNGKYIGSAPDSAINFGTKALHIGGRYTEDNYFLSGLIDEVQIYKRSLSSGEIQELYKTNLAKITNNKRHFSTYQSCLPEGGYQYELTAKDITNNYIFTGRNINLAFPAISIGTPTNGLTISGLNASITSSSQEFNFTGADKTFRVDDTKGYTGWYTTIQLSGNLTNAGQTRSIPQQNIEFKANNLIETLEGKTSQGVHLASGIENYRPMTGILNYIVKTPTAECTSCILGKYGNNPSLRITIGDSQLADTYHGTLVFTLYEGQ